LSCRTGRTDEAETLLRDPSLGGLAAAWRALFWHLKNAGQDAQLSVFATALIAQGDPKDLAKYARQLEPNGAPDTAITMWRAAAEHGDFQPDGKPSASSTPTGKATKPKHGCAT